MRLASYDEKAAILAVAEQLQQVFADFEILENDGRHGIRLPWIVARGHTRSVPAPRPGTKFIGNPVKSYIRRFYIHPSGYVVEGGRGGARVFYAAGTPHPHISAFDSICTRIRTRSISDAVQIVEALAPGAGT